MNWLWSQQRTERGIAMVVVLLVGAVMTVVASTATFVTIQEFEAGGDDREASSALAIAEAGVDRMIAAIKGAKFDWNELMQAGCPDNDPIQLQGQVAGGEFDVVVQSLDCPVDENDIPLPFEPQRVRILSDGQTAGEEANRRIEQMIRVVSGGLPIGVFAFSRVQVSGFGSGEFRNISLITPGNMTGRDKLETVGFDVWLSQADFYGPSYPSTVCDTRNYGACTHTNSLPAAVHVGGQIFCDSNSTCNSAGGDKIEHVDPGTGLAGRADLNCTANEEPDNSAWDGSVNGGPIPDAWACPTPNLGHAPTSKFTSDEAENMQPDPVLSEDDYLALRDTAITDGLYCEIVAGKTRCTKRGVLLCSNCGTLTNTDLAGLPDKYIIYADFPVSSGLPSTLPTLSLNADMGLCDLDPDESKSTVIVARYGNVDLAANKGVAGVIIAEQGEVDVGGGATVHGSIIAKELLFQGSSNFLQDACSLANLRPPFFVVTAESWREVDR